MDLRRMLPYDPAIVSRIGLSRFGNFGIYLGKLPGILYNPTFFVCHDVWTQGAIFCTLCQAKYTSKPWKRWICVASFINSPTYSYFSTGFHIFCDFTLRTNIHFFCNSRDINLKKICKAIRFILIRITLGIANC